MSKPKMVKSFIRNFRRALNYKGLYEKDASCDPFEQFELWLKAAVDAETFEPNAMTLATASADGVPRARTVLLKDYSRDGFIFYTNYQSRKGQDLIVNPRASLVFYWGALSRQVLIDGRVEKVDRSLSEDYFHARPRASQIAASVSMQSQVVKDRKELTDQMKQLTQRYANQEIPCPDHWGGFRLLPNRIEFWQGRPDRMHDRLCYTLTDTGQWRRERLAP